MPCDSDFPEKAFKAWATAYGWAFSAEGLPLRAARWAWARRGEEVDIRHCSPDWKALAGQFQARAITAEAARDGLRMELDASEHNRTKGNGELIAERDAALKKVELAPTIEDMGAMERAYREKFGVLEAERDAAVANVKTLVEENGVMARSSMHSGQLADKAQADLTAAQERVGEFEAECDAALEKLRECQESHGSTFGTDWSNWRAAQERVKELEAGDALWDKLRKAEAECDAALAERIQECGALDARLRMAEKNEAHANERTEQTYTALAAAQERIKELEQAIVEYARAALGGE